MRKVLAAALAIFCVAMLTACSPHIQLGRAWQEPLQEQVLEGSAREKILVLPVTGVVTSEAEEGVIRTRPGIVREIASHLNKARLDEDIHALLILVDSPGGAVVASEMLYHEIERFKEEAGVKAVSLMLSVAASGGYQAALAGDIIVAHSSTVTGSVGTIFIRPKLYNLMDKIGVGFEVTASGKHKDMASPLRPETPEEQKIIRDMIEDMNQRFLQLVESRREITGSVLEEVATARIYTASQAARIGLIDLVGFREDALAKAKELAELPEGARVVIYRLTEYPNDSIYNTITAQGRNETVLAGPLLPNWLDSPSTGFYYLWLPGNKEDR